MTFTLRQSLSICQNTLWLCQTSTGFHYTHFIWLSTTIDFESGKQPALFCYEYAALSRPVPANSMWAVPISCIGKAPSPSLLCCTCCNLLNAVQDLSHAGTISTGLEAVQRQYQDKWPTIPSRACVSGSGVSWSKKYTRMHKSETPGKFQKLYNGKHASDLARIILRFGVGTSSNALLMARITHCGYSWLPKRLSAKFIIQSSTVSMLKPVLHTCR